MDVIRATSKIVSLARCGFIGSARELFDKMLTRDTFAWNAMLAGYSRMNLDREALELFLEMRSSAAKHDSYTLTACISASAGSRELVSGQKLHALAVSSGCGSSLPVYNSLIDMYGKCHCPADASAVFSEMGVRNEITWCSLLFAYTTVGDLENAKLTFASMPVRHLISWNILMWGFLQVADTRFCLYIFKEMLNHGHKGDQWTFSRLMSAFTEEEAIIGCTFHALVIKLGLTSSTIVNNSVLSFYSKAGWLENAVMIFNSMQEKTPVTWNTILDACMRVGETKEALSVFVRMPTKNIVSWTTMIAGYARNGDGEGAFSSFVHMLRDEIHPDELTFGAVLHGCACSTILGRGKMVHGSLVRHGFDSYVYVGNGLVNMYAKCGDLGSSTVVFDGIRGKDLVSWNIMLFGFATHGWADTAFCMYNCLLDEGILPDKVTLLGLLMACSHSGLLDQGIFLFETMQYSHGVHPNSDHLNCVVDMLGRAGRLEDAEKLLKKYSFIVDQGTCSEALSGASMMHANLGIGCSMGKSFVRLKPHKDAAYVTLSNMYCASGQWEEAEKVRKVMVGRRVMKKPGCSWIEDRDSLLSP